MANTPSNNLPLAPENVLDPAAAINLALDTIDPLLQLAFISFEDAPPSGPTDGSRYIVGTGSGDWAGQDKKLARYTEATDVWDFFDARIGLNLDDGKLYGLVGSSWIDLSALSSTNYSAVIEEPTVSRSLTVGDGGKWILCSNVLGCEVTVPPQSSQPFVQFTEIHGRGATGSVVFVPGSGVTISHPDGHSAESVPKSAWTLKRENEDEWTLVGNLEIVS